MLWQICPLLWFQPEPHPPETASAVTNGGEVGINHGSGTSCHTHSTKEVQLFKWTLLQFKYFSSLTSCWQSLSYLFLRLQDACKELGGVLVATCQFCDTAELFAKKTRTFVLVIQMRNEKKLSEWFVIIASALEVNFSRSSLSPQGTYSQECSFLLSLSLAHPCTLNRLTIFCRFCTVLIQHGFSSLFVLLGMFNAHDFQVFIVCLNGRDEMNPWRWKGRAASHRIAVGIRKYKCRSLLPLWWRPIFILFMIVVILGSSVRMLSVFRNVELWQLPYRVAILEWA